ncbi:protein DETOXIFICATION 33-like [Papaver somniferum]|uniref:protein DETOXIFICATION 33-like n=1 Tax=Papaver somniferum TaxID=3469 RepID=UPI000E700CD1|nr:protein DETOXIFICATION 33-like [Papaver somniferum]
MGTLEYWTVMVLLAFAGVLKNAEVKVDAAAICARVSNELGAGNAAAAKFSVWVTVSIALVTQTAFASLLLITRYDFPKLFTDDKIVMKEVSALAMYLCISILLCAILPVLSGMAIGAGWQAAVAYVNSISYYLIGLPVGIFMGLKLDWGLEGLWIGLQIGMGLQTIVLLIMFWRADWDKEVQISHDRVSEDVYLGKEEKFIN